MNKKLEIDAQWLRQKYEVEGLSTYEIAKIIGCTNKVIHGRLKIFGIPTRPRGHNLKADDNYMQTPGVTNPFTGRQHSAETKTILSQKASVPKPWIRGKKNGMSGRTGPANHRYVDGTSPLRQRLYASGEWAEIVRTVYERDHYTCQRCGSPKKGKRWLHAHHVRSWGKHAALRLDTQNLVTLCRPCHVWVHSRANANREYLLD